MLTMQNNYLVIRDSLHGDIKIEDPVAIALVDAPEFQRLRRIHQMSGASLVFPGATHSRFIHSLGVYQLVSKILKNRSFKKANLNDRDRQKIALAGLLHDIGHGPLSHTFEQIKVVNHSLYTHEDYSALIITSPETEINKILQAGGFNRQEIQEIADFIANKNLNNPLSYLVNSQIDADRMDYLLRDDRYAGTGYGYTDIDYLTRHIKIDLKTHKIVFPHKALFSLENYLIGRYHMYSQVYHHPISVGFDLTFRMWFQRVYDLYQANFAFKSVEWQPIIKDMCSVKHISLANLLQLDDYTLHCLIKAMKNEEDLALSILSHCVLERKVFRQIESKEALAEFEKNLQSLIPADVNKYFIASTEEDPVIIYDVQKKPIWMKKNDQVVNFMECSELINAYQREKSHKKIKKIFIIKEVLCFAKQ